LIRGPGHRTVFVMAATLKQKLEAERQFRELLTEHGLPQPDAVDYGYWCIRFYYNESKTCVVVDLAPDATGDDLPTTVE
jgi:hypothetical protein